MMMDFTSFYPMSLLTLSVRRQNCSHTDTGFYSHLRLGSRI